MKLMNYDCRTLIMRNVRCTVREIPETYTKAQYQILCRLIKQKGITKEFFYFMLEQLFELSDWKQLDYRQMYVNADLILQENAEQIMQVFGGEEMSKKCGGYY